MGDLLFEFRSPDAEIDDVPAALAVGADLPSLSTGDDARLLSIGPHGSGLGFHTHGRSWIGNVAGTKVWWLYPPGAMPSQAYRSIGISSVRSWHARQMLQKLPPAAQPFRCVQRAGEVLWLPEFWWHATQNHGQVVAVGRQHPFARHLSLIHI
eukprot:TRINITY_DN12405_c0_g2_i1.p1 TRINITY_DN12405_c0_g2~~TRINITY_DN12405_c0_g2_i1.p1  ORF type:complete len:153 (+),score=23.55 TRINITY_DN12405_c0_g2_i1:3-461(+)